MRFEEPSGQGGEAARYAVLRRLGPALRHDLVVNLQSVTMMAEVLVSRLDQGVADPTQLHEQVQRMQKAARDAVAGSLAVAAWLAPPEDDGVDLREGIHAALELVHSGLGFRGFTLRGEAPHAGFQVPGTLLRFLLVAALFRLSDQAPGPGELLVRGTTQDDEAELTVQRIEVAARGDSRAPENGPLAGYRRIEAADLQALAATALSRLSEDAGLVRLRLQRWVPRTPLGIAPL